MGTSEYERMRSTSSAIADSRRKGMGVRCALASSPVSARVKEKRGRKIKGKKSGKSWRRLCVPFRHRSAWDGHKGGGRSNQEKQGEGGEKIDFASRKTRAV